jgi:hypothetical protein
LITDRPVGDESQRGASSRSSAIMASARSPPDGSRRNSVT